MLSPTHYARALRAKEICCRLGLTQDGIARAFGVTQGQVSRILNAKIQHVSALFEDVCLFVERVDEGGEVQPLATSKKKIPPTLKAGGDQTKQDLELTKCQASEKTEFKLEPGAVLIRPVPLPDELDMGYAGYVMRLNGLHSIKELDCLMRDWAGCQSASFREVSRLELLSAAANLSVMDFVLRHTTLPLRRGITSYQTELPHGSDLNKKIWWSTAMREARAGAFFCASCVQEDLDFHGRSYWRRSHQIPGLLSCPKHAVPLNFCRDGSAFHQAPSSWITNCEAVDGAWAQEVSTNDAISRYLAICDGLMDRTVPFAVSHVSKVLNHRAASMGLQTHLGKIKAPLLSDRVIEFCGRQWLALVMPALAEKRVGEHLTRFDGVLYMNNSASTTFAYALASAVLFESAEEALNALFAPLPETPLRRRRKRPKIELDELASAYFRAEGSYTRVAKELNIPVASFTYRLAAMGLPNMIEAEGKSTRQALAAIFDERSSLQQSAEQGGISQEELLDVLRVLGSGALKLIRKSEASRRQHPQRSYPLMPDAAKCLGSWPGSTVELEGEANSTQGPFLY